MFEYMLKIFKVLENILKYTAFIGLCYTIYNNTQQSKIEKKKYWYREHIIKSILPYLEILEKRLLEIIIRKKENRKIELEYNLEIKESFLILKKKMNLLSLFVGKENINDNSIFNRLIIETEKMEKNLVSFEEKNEKGKIENFCNYVKEEIYLYKKNNYKE